ncbi:unnamed protein product [Macrosiphum euphorbiae]|uniref:Uncharacterized protein n=1 Tax=Macrosiphum euphorbiae TaxID=13131 RepID=A0AAV0WU98_9HEMI|nr:unnamed protein product [Macrosiphum euphorbiae]
MRFKKKNKDDDDDYSEVDKNVPIGFTHETGHYHNVNSHMVAKSQSGTNNGTPKCYDNTAIIEPPRLFRRRLNTYNLVLFYVFIYNRLHSEGFVLMSC